MSILLVLIANLAGSDGSCSEFDTLSHCAAMPLTRMELAQAPQPREKLRHIAEVIPAADAHAESSPAPQHISSSARSGAADAITTPGPNGDWAVQVGAFRDSTRAQQFADRVGGNGAGVVPTRADGEDWYVVLLGTYPSRREADSVGRVYAETTGGSYWVRSAAGLESLRHREE